MDRKNLLGAVWAPYTQSQCRAADRYRQEIRKGRWDSAAALISILCDATACLGSGHSPCAEWAEANSLFQKVRLKVQVSPRGALSYHIGNAYEKMARCSLLLDHSSKAVASAWKLIDEAQKAAIHWDGIYVLAAELVSPNDEQQIEQWLYEGLKRIPQSSRLWIPYCVIKATSENAGQ